MSEQILNCDIGNLCKYLPISEAKKILDIYNLLINMLNDSYSKNKKDFDILQEYIYTLFAVFLDYSVTGIIKICKIKAISNEKDVNLIYLKFMHFKLFLSNDINNEYSKIIIKEVISEVELDNKMIIDLYINLKINIAKYNLIITYLTFYNTYLENAYLYKKDFIKKNIIKKLIQDINELKIIL